MKEVVDRLVHAYNNLKNRAGDKLTWIKEKNYLKNIDY